MMEREVSLKAAGQELWRELPKWIAQERRDVQQERDLCQRERGLRAKVAANLTGEQEASKEAALARQLAEETLLLLQLKAKRGQCGSANKDEGTGSRDQGQTFVATGPGASDVAPVFGPASSDPSGDPSGLASSPLWTIFRPECHPNNCVIGGKT